MSPVYRQVPSSNRLPRPPPHPPRVHQCQHHVLCVHENTPIDVPVPNTNLRNSSLGTPLTSSTPSMGASGSHRGDIHPNPICGIAHDTINHGKLRLAWRGAARPTTPPPSTRRAKYQQPTRYFNRLIDRGVHRDHCVYQEHSTVHTVYKPSHHTSGC